MSTWSANKSVLDMLRENKVFDELQLTKSFLTYSYPEVANPKEGGLALRGQLIDSITRNVVGRDFSMFNIINQALYQALLGKQRVLLAEMPDILHRQIVASNLSLDELKDIYKFTAEQLSKLERPVSFREAAFNFLPHIFQAPKDLYMTALLKESFQAATSIVALVGRHHLEPIKNSWIPPPNGINMTEACRIGDKRAGESAEDLIEKHALLDSLLEKRPWGQRYIHNPFPYLFDDVTQIAPERLKQHIECFQFHYAKYEAFKGRYRLEKQIPTFEDRKLELMENPVYDEGFERTAEQREAAVKLLMDSNEGRGMKNILLKSFSKKVEKNRLTP